MRVRSSRNARPGARDPLDERGPHPRTVLSTLRVPPLKTRAACRAFSTFEPTPDGGPVGAYRGGEPIATTRAWTRGYTLLPTFDFASFACGLDFWWRQILRVVNSA